VLSPAPVEDVVAQAKAALAEGYYLIKQKIGRDTIDEDIEMIKGLREGVGDDVRLTVDANGFWNYEQALYAMRKLEDVGLESIEQPLPRWDIIGMARLRQKIGTPVYADEAAQDLHHIREIIERQAADGLFIKMQKAGGLLKAQRWLTLARLSGLPVLTGCMSGSGLEASPAAHLLVADQWASQFVHENVGPPMNHGQLSTVNPPITDDIALNVPRFEGGKMWPNEGPGLGIDLNEDFIKEYQTPGKDIIVVE
jgi:L-alanine-DL-glutamate epimerase-like enolase superfamily enzyme